MVLKAIVIDIDGTITNPDRTLDLDVAKKFRELNVPVILSTGNPLCYVHAAAKLIGISGIVIAENGGVVSTGFDSPSIIADGKEECEKAYDLLSQYYELVKLDAAYRNRRSPQDRLRTRYRHRDHRHRLCHPHQKQ
jgi:phosphoglycolate phosphatase